MLQNLPIELQNIVASHANIASIVALSASSKQFACNHIEFIKARIQFVSTQLAASTRATNIIVDIVSPLNIFNCDFFDNEVYEDENEVKDDKQAYDLNSNTFCTREDGGKLLESRVIHVRHIGSPTISVGAIYEYWLSELKKSVRMYLTYNI